jgi:hypothetical protein
LPPADGSRHVGEIATVTGPVGVETVGVVFVAVVFVFVGAVVGVVVLVGAVVGVAVVVGVVGVVDAQGTVNVVVASRRLAITGGRGDTTSPVVWNACKVCTPGFTRPGVTSTDNVPSAFGGEGLPGTSTPSSSMCTGR